MENVKDFMDIFTMSFEVLFFYLSWLLFHINDSIIHKDGKPSQHYLTTEYGVHHHLECGRGVDEAKEHDCQFKQFF